MTKKTQPADAAVEPATAPAARPIVDPNTKIDTVTEVVRTPFEGTKVETHDQVVEIVQPEASYEETKIGDSGTVIRTYTGVQPGAQVVYRADADTDGVVKAREGTAVPETE